MKLYKLSRIYMSIARLRIESNFVFTIESFIKRIEFKFSLYERVVEWTFYLQP